MSLTNNLKQIPAEGPDVQTGKPKVYGGFNERAKQAQQKNIERDLFGRRQKEREASYNDTSKPR